MHEIREDCDAHVWVDRLPSPWGNEARSFALWNWSPLFGFHCCHQLGPHWSCISRVLFFLARLGPASAEVGLGFAVVGWFRRFGLPPPCWFCSVSVGLRFCFPSPFQGLPAPGQVCWRCCFLCPSSFAFPSPCPGLIVSIYLMFISCSFPFHPHLHLFCVCVYVCVTSG